MRIDSEKFTIIINEVENLHKHDFLFWEQIAYGRGTLMSSVMSQSAHGISPNNNTKIKESNLSLHTYGKLNNVGEAVYMQYVMGMEGVIVDFVRVHDTHDDKTPPSSSPLPSPSKDDDVAITRPEFSQTEIAFLLKLLS